MMRLKKVLKNNRGSSELVGGVLATIAIVTALAVCLMGMRLINEYTTLNTFGDQMIKAASDYGHCQGAELDARYAQLVDSLHIIPEVSYEADYVSPAKKTVQYGETIKLVATHKTGIGWPGFELPVTLTISKTGRSEQYWK